MGMFNIQGEVKKPARLEQDTSKLEAIQSSYERGQRTFQAVGGLINTFAKHKMHEKDEAQKKLQAEDDATLAKFKADLPKQEERAAQEGKAAAKKLLSDRDKPAAAPGSPALIPDFAQHEAKPFPVMKSDEGKRRREALDIGYRAEMTAKYENSFDEALLGELARPNRGESPMEYLTRTSSEIPQIAEMMFKDDVIEPLNQAFAAASVEMLGSQTPSDILSMGEVQIEAFKDTIYRLNPDGSLQTKIDQLVSERVNETVQPFTDPMYAMGEIVRMSEEETNNVVGMFKKYAQFPGLHMRGAFIDQMEDIISLKGVTWQNVDMRKDKDVLELSRLVNNSDLISPFIATRNAVAASQIDDPVELARNLVVVDSFFTSDGKEIREVPGLDAFHANRLKDQNVVTLGTEPSTTTSTSFSSTSYELSAGEVWQQMGATPNSNAVPETIDPILKSIFDGFHKAAQEAGSSAKIEDLHKDEDLMAVFSLFLEERGGMNDWSMSEAALLVGDMQMNGLTFMPDEQGSKAGKFVFDRHGLTGLSDQERVDRLSLLFSDDNVKSVTVHPPRTPGAPYNFQVHTRDKGSFAVAYAPDSMKYKQIMDALRTTPKEQASTGTAVAPTSTASTGHHQEPGSGAVPPTPEEAVKNAPAVAGDQGKLNDIVTSTVSTLFTEDWEPDAAEAVAMASIGLTGAVADRLISSGIKSTDRYLGDLFRVHTGAFDQDAVAEAAAEGWTVDPKPTELAPQRRKLLKDLILDSGGTQEMIDEVMDRAKQEAMDHRTRFNWWDGIYNEPMNRLDEAKMVRSYQDKALSEMLRAGSDTDLRGALRRQFVRNVMNSTTFTKKVGQFTSAALDKVKGSKITNNMLSNNFITRFMGREFLQLLNPKTWRSLGLELALEWSVDNHLRHQKGNEHAVAEADKDETSVMYQLSKRYMKRTETVEERRLATKMGFRDPNSILGQWDRMRYAGMLEGTDVFGRAGYAAESGARMIFDILGMGQGDYLVNIVDHGVRSILPANELASASPRTSDTQRFDELLGDPSIQENRSLGQSIRALSDLQANSVHVPLELVTRMQEIGIDLSGQMDRIAEVSEQIAQGAGTLPGETQAMLDQFYAEDGTFRFDGSRSLNADQFSSVSKRDFQQVNELLVAVAMGRQNPKGTSLSQEDAQAMLPMLSDMAGTNVVNLHSVIAESRLAGEAIGIDAIVEGVDLENEHIKYFMGQWTKNAWVRPDVREDEDKLKKAYVEWVVRDGMGIRAGDGRLSYPYKDYARALGLSHGGNAAFKIGAAHMNEDSVVFEPAIDKDTALYLAYLDEMNVQISSPYDHDAAHDQFRALADNALRQQAHGVTASPAIKTYNAVVERSKKTTKALNDSLAPQSHLRPVDYGITVDDQMTVVKKDIFGRLGETLPQSLQVEAWEDKSFGQIQTELNGLLKEADSNILEALKVDRSRPRANDTLYTPEVKMFMRQRDELRKALERLEYHMQMINYKDSAMNNALGRRRWGAYV